MHVGLKLHIAAVHEKIKINCNQCGKNFAKGFDLKVHVQTVQQKIKEFNCDHCGNEFDKE